MKLIINTSNLNVGGGLQVALSFINELKILKTPHKYHIFLSRAIAKQIDQKNFPDNFYFYLIERSPASLKTRKQIVTQLDLLEKNIMPNIVFSIFGPSYWKPKTKHIMGFAVPWVLQKDSVAYKELDFFKRIKMRLWVEYVAYYSKRDASHYIIETEDGKDRLSKVLDIKSEDITVIGNSYSAVFNEKSYLSKSNLNYVRLSVKDENEFRLLLISHNHPHKNLQIINKVTLLLKDVNIKFVLTIDNASYKKLFPNGNKKVLNIGPVKQKSCPSLYLQCHAMFLPTLLEVFSASYPEAMKMQKPILTSNYSFVTDICQTAALYFNPLNPEDIAKKIKQLVQSKNLQDELIEKGNKRIEEFETAYTRAKKYLDLCETIVEKSKNEYVKR